MSAIDTTKDFQERVFERIRGQIGELLSEDDLKKLVETAMERAFFERIKYTDRWGSVTTEPSSFQKALESLCRERVEIHIREWFKANEGKMQELVDKHAGQMLPQMLASMMNAIAQSGGFAVVQQLQDRGLLPR